MDPRGSAEWNKRMLKIEEYFDPGNEHYKRCLEALLGPLPQWNQETVGDIVESLLGFQYQVDHDLREAHSFPADMVRSFGRFPTNMVRFLHNWCLYVYRYYQSRAWEAPYDALFGDIRKEGLHVQQWSVGDQQWFVVD